MSVAVRVGPPSRKTPRTPLLPFGSSSRAATRILFVVVDRAGRRGGFDHGCNPAREATTVPVRRSWVRIRRPRRFSREPPQAGSARRRSCSQHRTRRSTRAPAAVIITPSRTCGAPGCPRQVSDRSGRDNRSDALPEALRRRGHQLRCTEVLSRPQPPDPPLLGTPVIGAPPRHLTHATPRKSRRHRQASNLTETASANRSPATTSILPLHPSGHSAPAGKMAGMMR